MALAKIATAQAATQKLKAKIEERETLTPEEKIRRQEAFIDAAPDGAKAKKKEFPSTKKSKAKLGKKMVSVKGGKVIITHRLYPEELEKLDKIAQSLGRSRSSLLTMIINRELMKY